jgi:rhodanese-related sulfurtransferase
MTWSEADTAELAAIVDRTVVDVRETDEYESGHIPGAVNVPLSVLTSSLDAIPNRGVVHVVCQAGGRSARACEFLSQQDRFAATQFVNVNGGTGAWILEGRDIVVGDQPD